MRGREWERQCVFGWDWEMEEEWGAMRVEERLYKGLKSTRWCRGLRRVRERKGQLRRLRAGEKGEQNSL
jgi:hypothetical protein